MIAVFIHVGQTPNNKTGGGKCPIFSDGTFKFVPVCVQPSRPDPDPTFNDMGLADFVPSDICYLPAFRSPEFDTRTYAHLHRAAEGKVYEKLKQEKGFLMFFSTLYYWDKEPPKYEWISPKKGIYIVGYFRVEGIYNGEELLSDALLQSRFRSNGQFGREKLGFNETNYLWICGLSGGRALLEKAVPLTKAASFPLMWNEFVMENLFTTGGKSLKDYPEAKCNWTLVCPQPNLSVLFNWINKFNESFSLV